MDPPPYSDYNGKLIPSRIPLRTMIVGMLLLVANSLSLPCRSSLC